MRQEPEEPAKSEERSSLSFNQFNFLSERFSDLKNKRLLRQIQQIYKKQIFDNRSLIQSGARKLESLAETANKAAIPPLSQLLATIEDQQNHINQQLSFLERKNQTPDSKFQLDILRENQRMFDLHQTILRINRITNPAAKVHELPQTHNSVNEKYRNGHYHHNASTQSEYPEQLLPASVQDQDKFLQARKLNNTFFVIKNSMAPQYRSRHDRSLQVGNEQNYNIKHFHNTVTNRFTNRLPDQVAHDYYNQTQKNPFQNDKLNNPGKDFGPWQMQEENSFTEQYFHI